jgi:hypothetical protein
VRSGNQADNEGWRRVDSGGNWNFSEQLGMEGWHVRSAAQIFSAEQQL